MVGTIYTNFWAALVGFCIYFFARFLTNQSATSIIIYSFVFALSFFVLTFVVRALLSFIMYTPVPEETANEPRNTEEKERGINSSNVPTEEQSEDIAQVVKTMLSKDNKM